MDRWRLPRPGSYVSVALFASTAALLAVGGGLDLAGHVDAAHELWMAGGAIGLASTLAGMVTTLVHRRLGVDAIAVAAIVGALWIGESFAAAVIALMVATGRALEEWAQGRASVGLRDVLDAAPRTALRVTTERLDVVDVDQLRIGDRVLVGRGVLVPADGEVLGDALVDESSLTGEALPVLLHRGDAVAGGTTNAGTPFEVLVAALPRDSAQARIAAIVEEARRTQAPFVRLADRFALGFLPVTAALAATAGVLGGSARTVAVLVVATPCPLVLAAPIAFVAGIARCAQRGVFVRSGAVLERLGACRTLVVDKTGTLTSGHPTVAAVLTSGDIDQRELLRLAGSLEQASAHVLAASIVRAALAAEVELSAPSGVEETPGGGIRGTVDGREVQVAALSHLEDVPAAPLVRTATQRARLAGGSCTFVAVEHRVCGAILLVDPVRPDALRAVRGLRLGGIDRIVLETGDRAEHAEQLASTLDLDAVHAGRLPADKAEDVRAEQRLGAAVVMVGDGINDAPALAVADVGIAIGTRGASIATESADAVLTVDRFERVGDAITTARRARRIALQSVVAGMALSFVAMVVALLGWLSAPAGAVLQELIDAAVILNALRVLRGPGGAVHLDARADALVRRFADEHGRILADAERIVRVADRLDGAPASELGQLRSLHEVLVSDVLAHELAEQAELLPAMDIAVGGHDPTGPMSTAHAAIAAQVQQLDVMVRSLEQGDADSVSTNDLRQVLYGLAAVLRLHTEQEEENYLSLREPAEAPRRWALRP